jgi:tRNA(Ile)-lysidine synthase
MVSPGDTVVCAVSGGADSIAMLWAFYLLREKLDIQVSAAHFNHCLRGEESDRDEAFVRDFCSRFDIPFFCGSARVESGKKGLEAAARDARYAYLKSLPGKIATAHTANDNAETVLMHMVRGTGLKGLGAIAPVNGKLIRPMLLVTRSQVLAFLEEYHLSYVTDSSNGEDVFLRNRLRRHVMPILEQENPRLAEKLSQMALGLREDEAALATMVQDKPLPSVQELRRMEPPARRRLLMAFLERSGVREPEREHVLLAENLVFSHKPSARASLPGGVTICRNYERLEAAQTSAELRPTTLNCPGITEIPELDLQVICQEVGDFSQITEGFAVQPCGQMILRPRLAGDTIRLSGGTKSLKKLFIDRKIPASRRDRIPVIADGQGVLAVYGVGMNEDRKAEALPCVVIRFKHNENSREKKERTSNEPGY